MKIYTEVNFEWDDKQGQLVEVSSKSFDYSGEVSLCADRGDWDSYEVYDAAGNKWVLRGQYGGSNNIGYIQYLFNDGQYLSDESPTGDNSWSNQIEEFKDWIVDHEDFVKDETQKDSTGYISHKGTTGFYESRADFEKAFKDIYTINSSTPEQNKQTIKEISTGTKTIEDLGGGTIEELGWGEDAHVSVDEIQGMKKDEMIEWIKKTKYGGEWPDSIDPISSPEGHQSFLTNLETNMPQMQGLDTTDWYGVQDQAASIGENQRNIYGGMGTGLRASIDKQKTMSKDIYKIEKGKEDQWEQQFKSFLGSLPPSVVT